MPDTLGRWEPRCCLAPAAWRISSGTRAASCPCAEARLLHPTQHRRWAHLSASNRFHGAVALVLTPAHPADSPRTCCLPKKSSVLPGAAVHPHEGSSDVDTKPGSAHTGSFLEQQPLSISFLRLQEHNFFVQCVTGVPAQTQGAGQHYRAPGSMALCFSTAAPCATRRGATNLSGFHTALWARRIWLKPRWKAGLQAKPPAPGAEPNICRSLYATHVWH